MTLDNLKEACVRISQTNPLIINGKKEVIPKTEGLSKTFNIREGILSFVDEAGALYVTPLTDEFVKLLLSLNFKWIRSLYVPFRRDVAYSCKGYDEVFAS